MTVQRYLSILRDRWVSMLVAALLILGVIAGITASQRPTYESSSSIFVLTDAGASVADRSAAADYARQQISTYADLVRTPLVLDPVVEELGLPMSPQSLAEDVSATVPEDTLLITITARSERPEGASDLANSVSESLRTQVRNLESGNGPTAFKLTVVSPAVPSAQPASPDIVQIAVLGLFAALCASVLVALLRDLLDNKVRKEDDIRLLTDAPVLASVPAVKSSELLASLSDHEVQMIHTESYRELRTNLRFLERRESSRSLLVTSSVKGEGKTATSINLAAALSRSGSRVLLIDADLRDPSVHDCLGIEGGAGLSNVLIGDADLEEVAQPADLDGLSVLASGPLPPNPSDLLDSPAMESLLDVATEHYDVVLLDSPPVLVAADATNLARRVSGTIFVAGSGGVRRTQLSSALRKLHLVQVRLLGIVLNGVPRSDQATYGHPYGAVVPDPRTGTEHEPGTERIRNSTDASRRVRVSSLAKAPRVEPGPGGASRRDRTDRLEADVAAPITPPKHEAYTEQ